MYKKMIIGAIAFLIASLLSKPSEFLSWLTDTVVGIVLSTLFLMPLAKILTGEKLLKATIVSFALGIVIFIWYMHCYLNNDLVKAIVFLCEWMATFALISVIFQALFAEMKEELTEFLGKH